MRPCGGLASLDASDTLKAMAEPKDPGKPPNAPDKGRPGEQTVLERDPKVQKPRMYKVILHNDDYTTMEFVVWVLQVVFSLDGDDSTALMWAIHKQGKGVAGVFTRDIAETKEAMVRELADENGMPLLCTIEPED